MDWSALLFLFFLAMAVFLIVKIGFGILKYLIANAIVGIIILGFLNWIGLSNVQFTPLNVLVVAIGGILGVIALVIISWF